MFTFYRRTHSASYQVVDSGSVSLPFDANKFSIKLQDLKFSFELAQDQSTKTQNIEIIASDDHSVTLKLNNFENPLGTSWESPVGLFNGKEINICMYISTVVGQDPLRRPRLVTYTFFSEEKQ